MCSWKRGDGEEGGEEGGMLQGATKPVAAARGPWTALQASVRHMRYLCNARTWGSRSRSRYWSGRTWVRSSSYMPLDTER